MNNREKAERTYEIIRLYANSNATMEAISGIGGTFFSLAVDGYTVVVYRDMWNEVRAVYGRGKLTKEAVFGFLQANLKYIASDIVFDVVVGMVPIIGIPFNYRHGKALTWRLGILFAISAAAREDMSTETMSAVIEAVRRLFPAKGIRKGIRNYVEELVQFKFVEPDRETYVKLLERAPERTDDEVRIRAEKMMDVWTS